MNLLDMANFICGKVNQTEPEDVAACKGFLARRHEMICKEEPWKDLVVMMTQALDASDPLTASGVILLPRSIDKVMALRTAEDALSVDSAETYFRVDPDAFAREGVPSRFLLMPPVVWMRPPGMDPIAVGVTPTSASDTATVSTLTFIDAQNNLYTETLNVAFGQMAMLEDLTGGTLTREILTWTKAVSTAALRLGGEGEAEQDPLGTIRTLKAAETSYVPHPRIRLIEKPTRDTILRVLARLRTPALIRDTDTPSVSGMENCLLAFATADMLQRMRQFGKAAELQKEGLALLDQLKKIETVQQAHNARIIPAGGYGDNDLVLGNRAIF